MRLAMTTTNATKAAQSATRAAAAQKAAAAANQVAVGSQTAVQLQTNVVKMIESTLPMLRKALASELAKDPQNPATITALRDSLDAAQTNLGVAQAQLQTFIAEAATTTGKAMSASVTAVTADGEVVNAGKTLEKDSFDAKAKVDSAKMVKGFSDLGARGVHLGIESIKTQLKSKTLTPAEKTELKKTLKSLQSMEASLVKSSKTAAASQKKAETEVKTADAAATKFKPTATAAQEQMAQEAKQMVKNVTSGVGTNMTAAALDAHLTTDKPADIALVDNVKGSVNSDRAMIAWTKIDDLTAKYPRTASRITPQIRQMLVNGVSDSRTPGDNQGLEGALGSKQVEDAAVAILKMPQKQYDQLSASLSKAGTGATVAADASAASEQALILKAVAARSSQLQTAMFGWSAGAMKDVTAFADDIRGESRKTLMRSTSTIDIASTNDSPVAPYDINGTGGVEVKGQGNTNDGHFQRFADTCGPTDAQIVEGEADPIAARHMSKVAGNTDPNTDVARQQREVLEANGGSTVPERAYQPFNNATNKANALKADSWAIDGMQSLMRGETATNPIDAYKMYQGMKLLTQVRAADGGHPTAQEMGFMANELDGGHAGMTLEPALNTIASSAVQHDFKGVHVTSTDAAGNPQATAADLAQWDSRLKQNIDIPIRVDGNGGGHFMVATDVRGTGANKKYEVSDPGSGRTEWVTAADMMNPSSNWPAKQFGNGKLFVTDFYIEK